MAMIYARYSFDAIYVVARVSSASEFVDMLKRYATITTPIIEMLRSCYAAPYAFVCCRPDYADAR